MNDQVSHLDVGPRQGRRWRTASAIAAAVAAAIASWAVVPSVVAQDAAPAPSPEYKTATEQQQLEILRRLLGVQAPAPKAEPAKVEAPPPPAAAPEPEPEPVRAIEPEKPAAKAGMKAKPAPKPKAAPKPKPKPTRAPKAEEAAEPPPSAGEAAPAAGAAPIAAAKDDGVPPVGTVIDAGNAEQWQNVLSPSLQWAVERGTRMEVIAPIPIPLEPLRAEATERYSSQVSLAPNKKALVNHVAGIPFPKVTEDDPDIAIKLMFNFEQRLVIDDVDGRDFGCKTGAIDQKQGVMVERNYRVGHFRRLFYAGRVIADPKPKLPSNEGLRYREALGALSEPFDLKGAGFSYNRYLDPARQDDSWLYYPQQKRVRRLSTAQRSEGVFGQDVDLDSYAGFAGNPAWFDWQLLGKKKVLLPLHAKHEPTKWGDKPVDFLFEDQWEPRDTWIIAARSRIPGYNFSLRVIYLDAQSFLIPITEVYDHAGQLWRAYIQQSKVANKPMKYATKAVYPFETFFVQAITVFDLQQGHATFCGWPSPDAAKDEDVWYYWQGKDGSQPENFDVAGLIQAGR